MMAQPNSAFMRPPLFPPARPRRPTCTQDWEDKRARIEQLYSEEDRPLKEVMEVMLSEDFMATYAIA